MAIRVIIDPTERRLPEGALAMVRQNGTLDIAMLIRSLIKQPREVPVLLRTTLDAAAAQVILLRNRQLLGPSFGLTRFVQGVSS